MHARQTKWTRPTTSGGHVVAAIILLAPLAVGTTTSATAQDATRIRPGVTVRITAPSLDLDHYVAVVRSVRGDTLDLGAGGNRFSRTGPLAVPVPSLTRLEIRSGQRSNWLVGAGVGATVGVLVGFAAGDDENTGGAFGDFMRFSAEEKALAGGIVLGTLGAVLGALSKTERWTDVPPERYRPRVTTLRDGRPALGLSVAF